MSTALRPIWTDISATKTNLIQLIQLLNRRLKGLGQLAGRNSLVEAHFDSGDAAVSLTVGDKLDILFPDYACTIIGWQMKIKPSSGATGSIRLDIWKKRYGAGLATVANTIISAVGAKPTIAAAVESRALTVNRWETKINKGDALTFNIDTVTNVGRCTLALSILKD